MAKKLSNFLRKKNGNKKSKNQPIQHEQVPENEVPQIEPLVQANEGNAPVAQGGEAELKLLEEIVYHGDAAKQVALGIRYENGTGVEKNIDTAAMLYGLAADKNHAEGTFMLALLHERGKDNLGAGIDKNEKEARRLIKIAADQGYEPAKIRLAREEEDSKSEEELKHLREEAGKGDVSAQLELGKRYEEGRGVKKDIDEAASFYKQAADKDSAEGWYRRGLLLERGRDNYGEGLDRDDAEARRHFKEAANLGHSLAKARLPKEQEDNRAATPEEDEVKQLKGEAFLGKPLALVELAKRHEEGRGVESDLNQAAMLYELAADHKNAEGAEANYRLGLLYERGQNTDGTGLEQDDDKAVEHFKKAAALDNADALYNLGARHEKGNGVKQDDAEAVRLITRAATLGNADAQYNLAARHEEERGVPRDDAEAVRFLQAAAEKKHPDAAFNLGLRHEEERGVPQNDAEAVRLYRLAANQGNASALVNLGKCLEYGKGVEKDEKTAVTWCYSTAAYKENAEGQYNLARCLMSGKGIHQNQATAARYFVLAAGQGHLPALVSLGKCYEYGSGVEQNNAEAVRHYLAAAERGDAEGQFNLAVCYQEGRGVPQEAKEAVKWYRKAVNQNYADALYNLGLCYERGICVDKNDDEAFSLLLRAANLGHPKAALNVGERYEQGRRVVRSNADALKLYKLAGDQGYAPALVKLGEFYQNGTVVEKDEAEALRLFRLTADQGEARAWFKLGQSYEHGLGVDKDEAEAVRHYQEAAQRGDAEGQYNLGIRLQDGRGINQDQDEAVQQYTLAADQGYAPAQVRLGECHQKGIGTIIDAPEAVRRQKEAAAQKHPEGQYWLGWYNEKGLGIPKSREQAERWYKLAAAQGNEAAKDRLTIFELQDSADYDHNSQFKLAERYKTGTGVPKNDKEAARLYQLAAQKGHEHAQLELGACYEEGRGIAKDIKEAEKWYRLATKGQDGKIRTDAAHRLQRITEVKSQQIPPANHIDPEEERRYRQGVEAGDPEAHMNLAALLMKGTPTPAQRNEAKELYQIAALTGTPEIALKVGKVFEQEWGEQAIAVSFYKMAAENGNTDAQVLLASRLEDGKGVAKDTNEAEEKINAASQQTVQATATPGNTGTQVTPTKEEAERQHKIEEAKGRNKKAIDEGDPYAMIALANIYIKYGTDEDKKEAIKLYNYTAVFQLGLCQLAECYERGDGVEQNIDEAIKWYTKAAARGITEAKNALSRLSKKEPTPPVTKQTQEQANSSGKRTNEEEAKARDESQRTTQTNAAPAKNITIAEAETLWRAKADAGDPDALFNLAETLAKNLSTRASVQEREAVIDLYQFAIAGKHAGAAFALANHFTRFGLAERNLAKAGEFFQIAADLGHPEALARLNNKKSGPLAAERQYQFAAKPAPAQPQANQPVRYAGGGRSFLRRDPVTAALDEEILAEAGRKEEDEKSQSQGNNKFDFIEDFRVTKAIVGVSSSPTDDYYRITFNSEVARQNFQKAGKDFLEKVKRLGLEIETQDNVLEIATAYTPAQRNNLIYVKRQLAPHLLPFDSFQHKILNERAAQTVKTYSV
jgi:uncharacterized protein